MLVWAQGGVVSKTGSSSPPPISTGPYYALVIGNNNYKYLHHLQTAVNDANSIAELLREQYGFQTKVLLDATRQQILDAIVQYRKELPENSNLLIYYAGHGHHDRDTDESYWLPVDAQSDSNANWISADDITHDIRAISSAHVLVISDSCYSGYLAREAEAAIGPAERGAYLVKMLQSKSRTLMSSGGDEPVADGGAPGHSIFGATIQESLRRVDEESFTAADLFARYVQPGVGGRSEQLPQYSVIRNSGHAYGDFVFLRQGASIRPANERDNQPDTALEQPKSIPEPDPPDAQSYLRVAEVDRGNGRYDQAMDALHKAAAIDPDSVEVQYDIAIIDQVQGKYDEATQILSTLLHKTEHADGHYTSTDKNNRALLLERLGTVYRESNRYPLAEKAFRQMLDLGDDNAVRGYQEIIETYRDNKQWQQATDVAEEAAKKYPNDRLLQMMAASQQADLGNSQQAVARVKAMAKGNADDREVYLALAQIYDRVRDWGNAEKSIDKAIELSPKQEDKDYAQFVAGSIYERQKKYDKAEEAFHKVLADDPKNAPALNYLGYLLADRGARLEEALGYIRRAVALEPQNGSYLDSLGWVYYKMGNYDLAEENLRRASERISDPGVQDHLGELYQKTGRLQLAATHWERCLEEWNKTIPAEVDEEKVAKVQKELEAVRLKLAKQSGTAATR